ncbi:MAG: helix-turn-helix transcriptional regulator [Bernardetiaceae bacterium]|nr:helix-turn-helix transcriptional regulator [Bernardetiaceae bacterium]
MSNFNHFNGEAVFHNLAAKFVMRGEETYIIKDKKYVVKKGEYIIANNNTLAEVSIKKKALGLCVDISNRIVLEAINHHFKNKDFEEFVLSDKFLINTYNIKNTVLGSNLNQIACALSKRQQQDSFFNTELFYHLAESIILDQSKIFKQYSQLNFRKLFINQENFRALWQAKIYIEEHYMQNLKIKDLLPLACMSEYAFIRLFKTSFGLSPHQYLIQMRLKQAKRLLMQGELVQDVAIMVGFADMPSFSKSFKQHFKIPPSQLLSK